MSEETSTTEGTQIYIVRATTGREAQLINRLSARLKTENTGVVAVMKPDQIKGYIFVEAINRESVIESIYGLKHAKGAIEKPIPFSEITHFFEPMAQQIVVGPNDIVELVSGPYKGQKAKVKRVDKVKEKIVVELLEAVVPIPVTVSLEIARVIDRKNK